MAVEGPSAAPAPAADPAPAPAAPDPLAPFREFAGPGGGYYGRTFLRIQRAELPARHVNAAAMLGSFVWAALRGNWLLFWIGFAVDMAAAVNLALVYKFDLAAARAAADGKDFLVQRYEGWTDAYLLAAVVLFIAGRLLLGWLADRLYYRHYARWRIDRARPSGSHARRLVTALLVTALIAPLTLYRASQFAPDERACIKLTRQVQDGKPAAAKARFDCWTISEFPTLVWFKRPPQYSYPRNEDGTRSIVVRESTAKRPVNLNTWLSERIDQGIGYLKAFYGWVFDGITHWLRVLLNAVEAVFVGTPWIVTAVMLVVIARAMAGGRVAGFVAGALVYLALFDFWLTAMSTISLVVAATLICVVAGLPLGVWVGKSRVGSALVTPILDVMQTIPSFVYLLPAVAFFSIGKPPGILATVIFAMPPMVRLTALGIRQVPDSTKEAALAFGASPKQLLMKVELPLALPSIMAGVNQVVMMSLSMVVIAAIIGAGGMGFIVVDALGQSEVGRGILAGVGIALIAMMIDRVVQKANQVKS